jgi:3'-5' exoribonuclease
MEQSLFPPAEHVDLRKLENGQNVRCAYAVTERELKRKKSGEPWLRLVLADASGSTEAVCWDDAEPLHEVCAPGTVVAITGTYEVNERWGSKVKINSLRVAAPDEYDADRLAPSSPYDVEVMEADLRKLLETIKDTWLQKVLAGFLGEGSPRWKRFREATAAKTNHQAYRYGLLEHTLSVARAVDAVAGFFPGVNRELAVTGALLHDIGKLWAYNADPLARDYTDAGKLEGEIPIGYHKVREQIEVLEGFPPELSTGLLHIILSHHGRYEYGSPVLPQTREAVLVHFIDNLGGRLGSFDRVERELPEGESWSGWDRALGGPVYFGREAAGDGS